jgi:lipopolysaccharide transport system ATP-binding protein
MSSDHPSTAVISARQLSKHYQLYGRPEDRLKQMIVPRLTGLIGRRRSDYFTLFKAVKEVSFTIGRGETVGIIGRNGSGKSTLLQLLCGTLQATSGRADVTGRIAALLELGAGFNPDFTGRENVYMNGAILGLSRSEIDGRFAEIERFAGIGEFIDQPSKTYSSGMYVRLAFAVAIHSNPDILVVDEALSVGDEAFQRKCFARIEELQARGTTILFVSHAADTIIDLCDRALLLDQGELLLSGKPKMVVSHYQRLMNLSGDAAETARASIRRLNASGAGEGNEVSADDVQPRDAAAATEHKTDNAGGAKDDGRDDPSWYDPGLVSKSALSYEQNGAEIKGVQILNAAGERVNNLAVGQRYRLTYNVHFYEDRETLLYGFTFKTINGVDLAGANNLRIKHGQIKSAKAGEIIEVVFDFTAQLMPGSYFATAGVMASVGGELAYVHRQMDVLAVRIMQGTNPSSFDHGLCSLQTGLKTRLSSGVKHEKVG